MTKGAAEIDSNKQQARILSIIEALKDQPGALLPILHNIQTLMGYVPDNVVPLIASTLNISNADVHGVISFYHHFRRTKPGNHVIQICRAESCQAMGAVALEHHVKQILAIDYHETTEDGNFSLEPVYCLGNCACSPTIAIDGEAVGDMDVDKFNRIFCSLLNAPAKKGIL